MAENRNEIVGRSLSLVNLSGMQRIKNNLKQVHLVAVLNAAWKSRAVKRQYIQTQRYYASRPLAGSADELFHRRAGDRLARFRKLGRKPRILFLGTDEEQDRGGIIQALESCGNVTLFHRADGSYGQNHPGPVTERIYHNTQQLNLIARKLEADRTPPDLIIAQTWASFIDPRALDDLRSRSGALFINLAMDDRHQYWGDKVADRWGGTFGLTEVTDLALTAAPECVDWYLKEGCPATFFPEASDPRLFHPMPEIGKKHDVCFVGGRYGIREKIVKALTNAGIQVTAYGSGWENGRIATEDVPQLFAQSKVVLGVGTIGHCKDFYSLKMRDFDGPLSGSLYLTHDNPDLYRLFAVGEQVVTYRSIRECVAKARYFIQNDNMRERMAAMGHAAVCSQHTWAHRFERLMKILKGQENL